MDSGFGINGHSKSVSEMTTSKLDYWSPLIVENGVKKSYPIEIRPHSMNENGPFEFSLPANPEKFIDITSLTLHGRVGIRTKDDKGNWVHPPKTDKTWGVINNFFPSLWSSIVVKMNDTEIGDVSNNSYPYTSYLQTLLGTTSALSKNHILKEQCFIKDECESMETPNQKENSSYSKRKQKLVDNDFTDFCIPIHNDLSTCEKYLPPGVKLFFSVRRSSDDFLIWKTGTNQYKVVVEDLHLNVNLLEVHTNILQNHFKQQRSRGGVIDMKYTQNILKTFAVPKGSFELKQHNLFFGDRLPNRIYLAFVEQESYNGSPTKNPYNFETASMREACVIVNGVSEPSPPLTFQENVTEKQLYFDLLQNTGTSNFDFEGVNISLDEFKKGYFILAYDRSPMKDNGLYTHKSDRGNITISVKCKEAISKNYMVLVFASYDAKLVLADDKVMIQSIY